MSVCGKRKRRHLVGHQNKDILFRVMHWSVPRIESQIEVRVSLQAGNRCAGPRVNTTIAVQFAAVKTANRYVPIRGPYVEAGSLAADAGVDDVRIRSASRELHGGCTRAGLDAASG